MRRARAPCAVTVEKALQVYCEDRCSGTVVLSFEAEYPDDDEDMPRMKVAVKKAHLDAPPTVSPYVHLTLSTEVRLLGPWGEGLWEGVHGAPPHGGGRAWGARSPAGGCWGGGQVGFFLVCEERPLRTAPSDRQLPTANRCQPPPTANGHHSPTADR